MLLRRLLSGILDKPAPENPVDLARDQELLRAAFRASPWVQAPPLPPSGRADEQAPGHSPAPVFTLRPVRAPSPIPLAPESPAKAPRPTSEAGPAPTDRVGPVRSSPDASTAPDLLLRAPGNVSVIADDFFDGLVRRVEGDDPKRRR
jgi:hypothetical protein